MSRSSADWKYERARTRRLESEGKKRRHEGNAYMFIDDVRLWIMPIRVGRDEHPFSARLEPAAPEWEKALMDALDHKEYPRSLAEVVCDFLQDLAVRLAYDGRALYEIIQGPASANRQIPFYLAPFSSEGVRRTRRHYIQEGNVLSTQNAQYEHVKVQIPVEDVWELRLPESVGSSRVQRDMLEVISQLSPYPPDWVQKEWAANESKTGYEFAHHRTETEVLLARATKGWYWDARMTWKDSVLEYYEVYRMLMFRSALAKIREHMVRSMNQLLRRLGCASSLVIRGVPTSEELAHIFRELEAGRLSYAAVLQQSATSPKAKE